MGPQSRNTVSELLYLVLTDLAELLLVLVGLPLTCPVGPGHDSQIQIRYFLQIMGQSRKGLYHIVQGFRNGFITVHRQAKFLQTQFCACNPLDSTDMSLNVQN